MPKVVSWTEDEWKKNLSKRLTQAKKYRESFEEQWDLNASAVYNRDSRINNVSYASEDLLQLGDGDIDEGDGDMSTNYIFKYIRFQHAQLSANPPSVIVRATGSDDNDKRAADAGDRLIRHAIKDQKLQDLIDQSSLKTMVRGTGWLKTVWNPDAGDTFDFNEETAEITMSGDIEIYSPATTDMWTDHAAESYEKIRYIFERKWIPYDEAVFMFPEHKDKIKATMKDRTADASSFFEPTENREEMVEIYEYYERRSPINGMAGRYAIHLEDGTLLRAPSKNPHYHAKLPYHLFTDIDVEDTVYGKSTVEYLQANQDMLNRFDNAAVDAMQAHGVTRMCVHEASEIDDDYITNSNYDIIRYSGAQQPNFMNPPALPPDMNRLRAQMAADIQDLSGVNDAMMGIQKREVSGFAQQTAIEAGNMIRRRLFNKYAMFVERIYKHYLGLVKEHWDEDRIVLVLGKEKAFEAQNISSADLAGGYDLTVEYGASLPLDPNMRREQIMILLPLLEKAGISMNTVLSMLKLNDLEGIYDYMGRGHDRQREIFEEMKVLYNAGQDAYIPPEKLEDHESMLQYSQYFRMSAEFRDLPTELQILVEKHIEARMEMAQEAAAPAQEAPPPAAPAEEVGPAPS